MSDDFFQREVNRRLNALEKRPVLLKGEITNAAPLSVALGGSSTPIVGVRAVNTGAAALTVGDVVWVFKWPGDLLILGRVS